jgi:hypothetical protein
MVAPTTAPSDRFDRAAAARAAATIAAMPLYLRLIPLLPGRPRAANAAGHPMRAGASAAMTGFAMAALLCLAGPAAACPGGTVRLVVPVVAGGPMDRLARALAEQLARASSPQGSRSRSRRRAR